MTLDADRFAALVCDWCLEVEAGQKVLISTSTLAREPTLALVAALTARGAWSSLALDPPGSRVAFLAHAGPELLAGANPFRVAALETADALLHIEAPANTRELAGVDPALLARLSTANRRLSEIQMSKRWAISIWPTPGLAQEAGMSEGDYAAFLERALFLDQPDPLAAWRQLRENQQVLVDRLSSAREVRIRSERTDITLGVTGRTWRNSDGRRNMPSGEVFTSPHETSANGHVYFDLPSNLRGANVGGISLSFVDGVVTAAHAEQGDAHLQAQLDTDAGARRLGEIGIGTNFGIDRATGSTLLDEKIGGTIHLALGRSYAECGGVNESAIHWDIVCDLRGGGEIIADGEVISRDGRFL